MKFKELFKGVTNLKAANVGVSRFKMTLDKESAKTPHFVMRKVEDMIENRNSLKQGLRQLTLFVMPDLHFESSDEKTSVFANEWLDLRFQLEKEIFDWIFLTLGGGNGYFEPQYIKHKNGNRVIDMLYNVSNPSMVYRNLNAKSDDEYWVMKYPYEVINLNGKKLKFYQISYVYGSYTWQDTVWGQAIHKDELFNYKFMWSSSPFYGSGLLSSAVDNEDIAEEILKNWALIAKYRSLSKKIIGFYNEDGESVDPSELDRIQEQFDMMEEEDSLLVNKKFVSEDLAFTGADNLMGQEMEFLRKDSGASLTPNYMTAFSQDSSFATASEAKVPFSLSIDSIQKQIENYLNNIITKNLKETYSFLDDDLRLSLGQADLYSRNETFNNMQMMYNMRACTFNELRVAAGLTPVEGGDIWGAEPPLDNIRTDKQVQITEKFNKKKALREKYNKFLKEHLIVPKVRKSKTVVIKENLEKVNDKNKNFKEAVLDMLK